jgi:hypothetical protein
MIAHVSLYKLKPDVTEERLEECMSRTRVLLLRVPEILAVRTGKRTKEGDPWQWFVMLEIESLDKLAIAMDDPSYFKFRAEVISSAVAEDCVQSFEMEPRKNVKYS